MSNTEATGSASFDELVMKIRKWSEDRKITENGRISGQARKLQEEAGELVFAAGRFHETVSVHQALPDGIVVAESIKKSAEELADAIGDVIVTALNVAWVSKMDPVRCLEHAYNQIKDRKGFVNEDGVFVKQ